MLSLKPSTKKTILMLFTPVNPVNPVKKVCTRRGKQFQEIIEKARIKYQKEEEDKKRAQLAEEKEGVVIKYYPITHKETEKKTMNTQKSNLFT